MSDWRPTPLPWREIIASWPIPARRAFGERANELLDQGCQWPEDEWLAYRETRSRLETGEIDLSEPEYFFPVDPDLMPVLTANSGPWHPTPGKRTFVLTHAGHVLEIAGRVGMPADAKWICSEGGEWHRLPDPPDVPHQETRRARPARP